MELHRFFRYAIEKMCKEKKSLNHFNDLNASCKAFPEGIPFNMLEGKITHEKPIKGQTGNYLFTPEEI